MAKLIPPTRFFRIMPDGVYRQSPSAWHALKKMTTEDIDEDKQRGLGWPAVITYYYAACGVYSEDLKTKHEFRPVHDVPYKHICKKCWPYLVEKSSEEGKK